MSRRGPTIELQVNGATASAALLTGMGARARDARPAFQKISEQLMKMEEHLFETKGASGDREWPINRPWTIALKASKGQPLEPERASEKLMRSLTERGAEDQLLRVNRQSVRFGTKLFYAVFQMKKRPLFQIQPRDGERAAKTLMRWVCDGIVA